MTKRTFNILVGLTLILGLLWSCHSKPKNGRTDTYSSGTMSFTSDESFSPIIEEMREVFEHTYPQATIKPIYTNELDGINSLMQTKVWLTVAARRLRDSEVKNFADRKLIARSCYPNSNYCSSFNSSSSTITNSNSKHSNCFKY